MNFCKKWYIIYVIYAMENIFTFLLRFCEFFWFIVGDLMKKCKFCLGITAFTVSSAMIPLMSIFTREKSKILATAIALVFWIMLIVGIVATVLFGKTVKHMTKKKSMAFIPFQTRGTRIIDLLFIISLLATFVVIIGKFNVNWLQIALLFADIYLLELHFLFSLKIN